MASLLCATNRGTFPMFELLSCKRRQPDNHWFVFSYSKFLKPVLCISSRPISLDLKYGWIIGGLGFAPQAKCYVILAVRNVTVACVLAPVGVWVDDPKFMSIWRWALAMPNLPAHSGLITGAKFGSFKYSNCLSAFSEERNFASHKPSFMNGKAFDPWNILFRTR